MLRRHNFQLENECICIGISKERGDICEFFNKDSQKEIVNKKNECQDTIEEGGYNRPQGLSIWVKTGRELDHNTGVLSAFAPIHSAKRSFEKIKNGILFIANDKQFSLTIEYHLPPGKEPLFISATLTNISGERDSFQFESYYRWFFTEDEWEKIAYYIPGLPIRTLAPYGELYYYAGTENPSNAIFWQIGTDNGILIKSVANINKFFVGVQKPFFILGPHSNHAYLNKGEKLTMSYQIMTLKTALQNGEISSVGKQRMEEQLLQLDDERKKRAIFLGGIRKWCTHIPPKIKRRFFHITTQYSPVGADKMLNFIEEVVLPAGFNEIVFEVGHNFKYKSHPRVAPNWGWDGKVWRKFVKKVKKYGINVIPEYNSLGHQGESGLTKAYPELAEDPYGWCLNPEHPKTAKYLGEIFDELIEVFEPVEFHVGLDEVDVPSRPQTFALPKKGRNISGGELFALHINNLHQHLSKRRIRMMMWADMLLYKSEHNVQNGLRTGAWKAIDIIPKDIIMVDWIYHKATDFGGSRYLINKGFDVVGACWHIPENIQVWTLFAERNKMLGMMHTTWAIPSVKTVNMICTLLAGKLFQKPYHGKLDKLVLDAESLATGLCKSLYRK